MKPPSGEGRSAYEAAGVDYGTLDALKRNALAAGLATSGFLELRGARALDESRGEPAFVFELGGRSMALVLEGLGTKAMIARAVAEDERLPLGGECFANVAYDAVAAIINDLCCVGALPLVVNAYFATGSSGWYEHADRQAALLDGWRRACSDAQVTWGGGESPSLPGLVNDAEIELAGSAVGIVPEGRLPILGSELRDGDEIVIVESAGLHANGASLARALVDDGRLDQGYATPLPSGRSFGEALLDPSKMYAPLVAALLQSELSIHYLSHITGHGLLKLMRPSRDFTYRITQLPQIPEVLTFIADAAEMDAASRYSTFNMGCGYAIYCASGEGAQVVELAARHGYAALVAGAVERGPRQVMLEPENVVFGGADMDLTPSGG